MELDVIRYGGAASFSVSLSILTIYNRYNVESPCLNVLLLVMSNFNAIYWICICSSLVVVLSMFNFLFFFNGFYIFQRWGMIQVWNNEYIIKTECFPIQLNNEYAITI